MKHPSYGQLIADTYCPHPPNEQRNVMKHPGLRIDSNHSRRSSTYCLTALQWRVSTSKSVKLIQHMVVPSSQQCNLCINGGKVESGAWSHKSGYFQAPLYFQIQSVVQTRKQYTFNTCLNLGPGRMNLGPGRWRLARMHPTRVMS